METQKTGVGFGVASMVCGILSLLLSCCLPVVPFILSLIAVILGGVGIKKNSGKGMAIAGLVCGIIALIPAVMVVAGFAEAGALLNSLM